MAHNRHWANIPAYWRPMYFGTLGHFFRAGDFSAFLYIFATIGFMYKAPPTMNHAIEAAAPPKIA